ncbi:MAG: DUF481 domain-containing protein [Bryobacteraceae bacterium]
MVDRLETDDAIRVETASGLIVQGRIRSSEEGVEIVTTDGATPLSLIDIVEISPTLQQAEGEERRLRGTVDLGYTLTRGNVHLSQSSLGINSAYRSPKQQVQLEILSLFSRQSDAPTASSHLGSVRWDHYLSPRLFSFTLTRFERNDRQLLLLRSNLGGGLGWKLLNTQQARLSLLGGFTYVNEQFRAQESLDREPRVSSGEGLFGLDLETLSLGPLRLITKATVYPNIVDRGRYRATFESGIRFPLTQRLTWNIQLFNRFDSRPPREGVKRNDVGVITSVGVSF